MRATPIAKVSAAGTAVVIGCLAYLSHRARKREKERLTAILGWQPGSQVADVGAGSGRLMLAAAGRVGPEGQVFATEIDRKKLAKLRKKVSRHQPANITVVEADDSRTGLPPDSCDAILLRGSYHHFTDPASLTTDLYRALRPGGVVAIVDFAPRRWLTLISPVKRVPANRGGHGIPMHLVLQEMTSAGFEVQELISRWFLDVYCLVFRKPTVS